MLIIALIIVSILVLALLSFFLKKDNEEINETLDPFHILINKEK